MEFENVSDVAKDTEFIDENEAAYQEHGEEASAGHDEYWREEEAEGGRTAGGYGTSPDTALIDALKGTYGNDAERIATDIMREAALETETRFGVPHEAGEVIARARVRGGGAVGHMTRDEERVFVRGIMQQESRIRQKDPTFDLETELRKEPTLRVLLASGEPLEKALSYINFEAKMAERERETEERVVSRIRARNTRPQPIGRAGTGTARVDFSRATADEMREIDNRLKRGEKVYLG